LAARGGGFNGGNDDVADIGVAAEGAAEYADAHNFFGPGIIADVETGLLLNHGKTSLLSLFDDLDEAPAFLFREGASFHDRNLIADVCLVIFVVSHEFDGPFNGFFIEFMLNEFLDGDDDSFIHFIGNDVTDTDFAFVTNHAETSLSDIELAFANDGIDLSDGAFNLADTHGIFELTCSMLEAEVEEFFFKRNEFSVLFVGREVAEIVNFHALSPPSGDSACA